MVYRRFRIINTKNLQCISFGIEIEIDSKQNNTFQINTAKTLHSSAVNPSPERKPRSVNRQGRHETRRKHTISAHLRVLRGSKPGRAAKRLNFMIKRTALFTISCPSGVRRRMKSKYYTMFSAVCWGVFSARFGIV